jgi:hypothetical protein
LAVASSPESEVAIDPSIVAAASSSMADTPSNKRCEGRVRSHRTKSALLMAGAEGYEKGTICS